MKDKIKALITDYEELKENRRIELRLYKTRWVGYHTILATELALVVFLLLAILIKL